MWIFVILVIVTRDGDRSKQSRRNLIPNIVSAPYHSSLIVTSHLFKRKENIGMLLYLKKSGIWAIFVTDYGNMLIRPSGVPTHCLRNIIKASDGVYYYPLLQSLRWCWTSSLHANQYGRHKVLSNSLTKVQTF